MYSEINRCLNWHSGVQSPVKLESHHVQAVSDICMSQDSVLSVAAQKGDDFYTELISLLIGVLIISESSTLLLSRVYRACAMEYGLSSDNVSTKLCNRTLHSVEPNLYARYILDIFLWVWNLVSRVKEIRVG